MWLTQKFNKQKSSDKKTGVVINDGDSYSVLAQNAIYQPQTPTPYGMSSKLPIGTAVFVKEETVLGSFEKPPIELENGEVCIYSAGGALIHLKNNGEVLINGQVFAPFGESV